MDGKHLKLDLGSGNPAEGELRPEGYLYQDIEPHPGIDLVCDIAHLHEHIKPEQCERIRMSHVLEHFATNEIVPILKMIRTLLEKDGILEIHVPNFKWHAALLLEDQDEDAIKYAFGGQIDEYDFHKTAFTPLILIKRLQEAGFNIVSFGVDHSIHAEAKK